MPRGHAACRSVLRGLGQQRLVWASQVFEGVNIDNQKCIIKILKPVKKKKVGTICSTRTSSVGASGAGACITGPACRACLAV